MLKGFRDFIMRGNVVDLAVAVVLGAAFGAVVASLVADLLTPIIAMIVGEPDFGGLTFTINDAEFRYGSFLNALIAFVSVAGAIYFFVVTPMNKLRPPAPPTPMRACPECQSEIFASARRCPQCTAQITPTQ